MENPNPHAGKPHPAAPLTPATRPLYREIEKLRLPGWEQNIPARVEIADYTQQIWKAVRDSPKRKRKRKKRDGTKNNGNS